MSVKIWFFQVPANVGMRIMLNNSHEQQGTDVGGTALGNRGHRISSFCHASVIALAFA